MSKTIQLVIMCDRTMIWGAHATLASALARLPADVSVTITAFVKGWSSQDRCALELTARLNHSRATILFLNADDCPVSTFAPVRGARMNYHLFTIPNQLSGVALYLDCDLLVRIDLMPLFDIDLGSHIAAAVSWESLLHSADKALFNSLKIPLESPHFNCGVMLIDCEKWKEYSITDKCVALRKEFDARLRGGNQPIINAVLWRQIATLQRRYNTPVSPHRVLRSSQLAESRVWHMVGRPKPWDPLGMRLHCLSKLFLSEIRRSSLSHERSFSFSILQLGTLLRFSRSYLRCLPSSVVRLFGQRGHFRDTYG